MYDSGTLRVLIIIPCYNEGLNINELLNEINQLNAGYSTVVVDDGSEDDTYAIASRLSTCVRLVANIGIGGAVQTGIKYAYEHGYDLCIQCDGDGQHLPEEIGVLIDSYRSSPANLIIGSRFISGSTFRSTWARRFGIRIISYAIRLLFGVRLTDPTSGFRLMDIKAIRLFSAQYPHDFPQPISAAIAIEEGFTVREVPVNMRPRKYSRSSIRGIKTLAYMLRIIGYLILIRLGRHI